MTEKLIDYRDGILSMIDTVGEAIMPLQAMTKPALVALDTLLEDETLVEIPWGELGPQNFKRYGRPGIKYPMTTEELIEVRKRSPLLKPWTGGFRI